MAPTMLNFRGVAVFLEPSFHVPRDDWLSLHPASQQLMSGPQSTVAGAPVWYHGPSGPPPVVPCGYMARCTDELSCSRNTPCRHAVTVSGHSTTLLLASAAASSTRPSHDTLLQAACVRHPCVGSLSQPTASSGHTLELHAAPAHVGSWLLQRTFIGESTI